MHLLGEIHKETAALELKYKKETEILLQNNKVGAAAATRAVSERGVSWKEALSIGRAAETALLIDRPTPPVVAGCVLRKTKRAGRKNVMAAEFHIFTQTNIDTDVEAPVSVAGASKPDPTITPTASKSFNALALTLVTVLTRVHTLKTLGDEPFQRAQTSLCYASPPLSFLLKLTREDLLYVDCPIGPLLGASSETFYTSIPLVSNNLDRECMEEAAARRKTKMKFHKFTK